MSYLYRFLNSPSNAHFSTTKRVVRYLGGTWDYRLWYAQGDASMLEAYSDNDWGGSLSDWKSTLGVLLRLESSVVSWSSKKQEIVALSTTEAEYIVTTSEAYQIFWFRRILQEYGMLINGAIPLWCDNQSAIVVAKNPAHHGRIKHIMFVITSSEG